MSLFHIYVLTIRGIDPWYFRSMHVLFAGVLVFALVPGWATDIVGFGLVLFVAGLQYMRLKKGRA